MSYLGADALDNQYPLSAAGDGAFGASASTSGLSVEQTRPQIPFGVGNLILQVSGL